MLEHWMLDPDSIYLNHGTVGATPRRVLLKQQELRDEMERQPSRFMLRELNGHQPMPWRDVSRLREASDQVAAFVGSRADDLVFVPNVTTGLNAVLGSLPLGQGDEVVITDLAYGAIALASATVCDRSGATLRTVHLEYPMRNADRYVAELWKTIQQMAEYKDKTALVLTTDHGRGNTRVDWTDHGKKVAGAEYIWMAVMGPDTPAKGVRENVEATQSQVAATIARLLGEDFQAVSPKAAAPLADVCP